jgi:glycolate oxidase
LIEHLVPAMVEICGPDGVVTDPLDLRTYECDGLTSHRAAPGLVVLPRDSGAGRRGGPRVRGGQGSRSWPAARHRPVRRRAPRTDGVLIVTSRMRRIIAIDPASQRAIVEPGVTNWR